MIEARERGAHYQKQEQMTVTISIEVVKDCCPSSGFFDTFANTVHE